MSVRKGKIIELPPQGRFKVGNMLGSGAFGVVFVVNKMERDGRGSFVTPEAFALKVIECNEEGAVVMAVKEAQTLMKIKHKNIVQLIHPLKKVGISGTFVYLLTEYCSGGNLNDRLRHNTDPSTKLNWLHQLASAISHLHSRRPMIVHRDLKPANVLLTANDDIKVADFGLARQYEALKQLGSSSSFESYYMNSGVGTHAYLAPEILTNHYTEKADIFSLGVIFYAILEGCYILLLDGSKLYGAFVNPNESTPLGIAMYYSRNSKPREELNFQMTYKEHDKKVAKRLETVVRKCFLYRSGMRPKATEICEGLERLLESESEYNSESDHNSGPITICSGSEDESDHNSVSEDGSDSGSEDESDHNCCSEYESDHNSGSEDESDHNSGSEDESDHNSGSEDESDHNSGSEDESDHNSCSEYESDHNSGSEDESDHNSGYEDEFDHNSGSEDESDHNSGSEDASDHNSGSKDEFDHNSGSEDESDEN